MKFVLLLSIFGAAVVFADHHHHRSSQQTGVCEVGNELKEALTQCGRDLQQQFTSLLQNRNDNDDDSDDSLTDSVPNVEATRGPGRRRHGWRHVRRSGIRRSGFAGLANSKIFSNVFYKNSRFANCAFQRVGVIGPEFQFNQEEAINMIEEAVISDEIKDTLKEMIADCVTAHSGATTASPILGCMHTSFRLACLPIPSQTESGTEAPIDADE